MLSSLLLLVRFLPREGSLRFILRFEENFLTLKHIFSKSVIILHV